ncbi:MAG: hypothetical protein NC926_09115 [Candidatus Omnitrophica bacterium]|nr:hypothetical protein [Candidatus Omnitrophota bacterium]
MRLFKLFLFLLLFFLTSCGAKTNLQDSIFIDKNFDFTIIKRIAVIPFENYSENREAGEIIRQLVIHELQSLTITIPSADVDKVLKAERINKPEEITTEIMQKLAKELKVDVLIGGIVYKYGETREGIIGIPEVSINLKVIDPQSGTIVFSIVKTERGGSFWTKHFGAGAMPITQVALKVISDAVKKLAEL